METEDIQNPLNAQSLTDLGSNERSIGLTSTATANMSVPTSSLLGIGGRGSHLVIVSIVFTLMAFLMVVSRIVFRTFMQKKGFGYDDGLIVFSMFTSLVMGILDIIAVDHGYGRHSDTIPAPNVEASDFYFWLVQVVYKTTINSTKCSIVLLYLRIFTPDKKFRYWCWALLGFVGVYGISSVLLTIFQCSPPTSVWDKNEIGRCINLTAFWYANAGLTLLSDIAILVLPIPVISTLHMPRRQKMSLIAVFAVGGFVCVTTILRMLSLSTASRTEDPNYGTYLSDIWTSIEANTGIICACMPMLKQPLTFLFPRLFPSGGVGSCNASNARRYSGRTGIRRFDSLCEDTIRLEHGANFSPSSREREFPETYHIAEASADSAAGVQNFEEGGIPMGVIETKTKLEVQYDSNPNAHKMKAKEFLDTWPYQAKRCR